MLLARRNTLNRIFFTTLGITCVTLIAGCGLLDIDDQYSGSMPAQSAATLPGVENSGNVLTISGSPHTATAPENLYSFQPQAYGGSGQSLSFSIDNKPEWASFDAATGQLSGTPNSTDIGSYSNISIEVFDGQTTATLESFDIDVLAGGTSSILLSWSPPTARVNGEPLVDMAGYRFYYGREQGRYSNMVEVNNPGISMFEIGNLSPGNWYFVASVYDQNGAESPLSNQAMVSVL